MIKFLREIMDWWHGPAERHDFFDPHGRQKPKVADRWTRQQVLELAKKVGIILPSERQPPPEPVRGPIVPFAQHRGRNFAADPYGDTLAIPADLEYILQQLKQLGHPFLLVAHKAKDARGVHGWCNGSNWGRTVLEELARCAELNFKLEMEKCGGIDRAYAGEKTYSGRIPGEFLNPDYPDQLRLK